ncbi:MAG: hypothetical protein ACTS4U_02025 [Candidatus Hodgkinia cicadicola]
MQLNKALARADARRSSSSMSDALKFENVNGRRATCAPKAACDIKLSADKLMELDWRMNSFLSTERRTKSCTVEGGLEWNWAQKRVKLLGKVLKSGDFGANCNGKNV